ncbi:5-hydroxytryptamine (serotonin) receptor 1A b [Hippoglossus hippoglossus]|uniref:5-hydroxytryptamine (serotonin) receptor 1A b n=1 Tax=Hippoglossus hippoglossus TaxID=8267 RepID=UPI00148C0A3E|nr:5-hydroxytryptamine (serotonin) receptor 1A b [Hippoglossus hippoglossus]XP_035040795.1 5-hydroxytryptamine (serotonin) receptor 1A b [Hippoglossus stenolepis]
MEAANNSTAWTHLENFSIGTPEPEEEEEEVKLSYQVLTSFVLAALILCAIFGNACVVAAVALERSLQNVASYLIGSLAVTDLMVSVLVLPMAALYQVLNRWTLGQVPCDIFISLDMLCCTSSILHLCAIALDRYWAITEPIEYMKKRTPRRAAVLISVTWIVGFSISVPPMLIMSSQPNTAPGPDRASTKHCEIRQDPWYTIYSTFGAFYIPLTLMLVLYGRIFKAARFRIRKTVRKTEKKKVSDSCLALSPALLHKKTPGDAQSKSWKRSVEPRPLPSVNGAVKHAEDGESLEIIEVHSNSKSNLPLPDTPSTAPLFESRHEKATEAKRKIAMARERKTVKTLGIIMGTFILCWLPFFIVALVKPFCPDSCYMPRWLEDVINWLGYSNSLLNPIIYAYFNKDFQSAFKKIIKCHFCRP